MQWTDIPSSNSDDQAQTWIYCMHLFFTRKLLLELVTESDFRGKDWIYLINPLSSSLKVSVRPSFWTIVTLRNRLFSSSQYHARKRVHYLDASGRLSIPRTCNDVQLLQERCEQKWIFPVVVSGFQMGLIPWFSCWPFRSVRRLMQTEVILGLARSVEIMLNVEARWQSSLFAMVEKHNKRRFRVSQSHKIVLMKNQTWRITLWICCDIPFSSPLDRLPPSFHGLGIQS